MADAIGYMLSPHPRLDPIPNDVGASMVWNRTTVERWKVRKLVEYVKHSRKVSEELAGIARISYVNPLNMLFSSAVFSCDTKNVVRQVDWLLLFLLSFTNLARLKACRFIFLQHLRILVNVEFLLLDQNIPFMVALLIVLMVAALEVAGALIGINSAVWFDALDGDAAVDGLFEPPLPKSHILTLLLAWLRMPRVPALVLLLILLLHFGASGLLMQSFSLAYLGRLQPLLLAIPSALAVALPLSYLTTQMVVRLIPQDCSSAISWYALVGVKAEITLGQASAGFPARAKARDATGKMHYFMVEPEDPLETFMCGDQVLLVRCVKGHYFAKHTAPPLENKSINSEINDG
jgi:hypothetical protein